MIILEEKQKKVGRPRTTEDTPLTDKQLLFCEYYLETLNQSESYRRVAPHVADTSARVEACKLMKKPNIRKYINDRLESMKEARVVDKQELLNFYSEVMRGTAMNYGKPIYMKDRIACADSLGKYYGMFVDKKEIKAEVTNITVDIEGLDDEDEELVLGLGEIPSDL